MIKKIIFLDVDGPMIPARMYYGGIPRDNRGWHYDPIAAGMIRNLCDKHGARVVYNSSHNDEGKEYILDQAVKNISINPFAYLHPDYMTTFPSTTYKRETAIEIWLREHPETEKWVAIDDFPLQLPNAVQIDYAVGITIDNYERIDWFLK